MQCLRSGLRLTKPAERDEIKRVVAERTADLPDEDLGVLGYHDFAEALSRGIAAHHAGMLAAFKEVVEELFARGLIKVVFATETLALGINMPARTVVLEKLSKWNGEAHVDITPGEYTQLTGRAGRRGIDVEGHAVVLWQPGFDPREVAGLASTRTYPLRSSFSPSYNMAVNLVRQVGRTRARDMLELSFAQFQSDQAVVGLARQVQRNTEALEGYKESIECHLGDFLEYAALRRRIGDREASGSKRRKLDSRVEAQESIEKLRTGDIIRIPAGRSAGWALVLDPGFRSEREGPRPTVLTLDRQVRKLSMVDFPRPVEAIGTLRIPRKFNPRNPQQRRELAQVLRTRTDLLGEDGPPSRSRGKDVVSHADDPELQEMRAQLRAHPCHGCSDREDHARWAERYFRLDRENRDVQRKIEQRTNTIARQFDRVCQVLDALHYLDGDKTTEAGDRLARIYTELDLVAAECLRQGVFDDLDRAGAGRVSGCAGLRVAVEGRADLTAVAARRRTGGRGADGVDLARLVRAGTRHAGRLPAVDGPGLLLARLPLGVGRIPRGGPVRVRPGSGRLRPLGQAADRPDRTDRRRRRRHPTPQNSPLRRRPNPPRSHLLRLRGRRRPLGWKNSFGAVCVVNPCLEGEDVRGVVAPESREVGCRDWCHRCGGYRCRLSDRAAC